MLLAYRLVKLIETHSDGLARTLQEKIDQSERCEAYRNVSQNELTTVVGEIYRDLGKWLLGSSEEEVAARYLAIGARRSQQGVPASQLIWVIALVKQNLLEYIQNKDVFESPAEAFGGLEMVDLLEQFFDRAMYYAALGHERSRDAHIIDRED